MITPDTSIPAAGFPRGTVSMSHRGDRVQIASKDTGHEGNSPTNAVLIGVAACSFVLLLAACASPPASNATTPTTAPPIIVADQVWVPVNPIPDIPTGGWHLAENPPLASSVIAAAEAGDPESIWLVWADAWARGLPDVVARYSLKGEEASGVHNASFNGALYPGTGARRIENCTFDESTMKGTCAFVQNDLTWIDGFGLDGTDHWKGTIENGLLTRLEWVGPESAITWNLYPKAIEVLAPGGLAENCTGPSDEGFNGVYWNKECGQFIWKTMSDAGWHRWVEVVAGL